MLNSQLATRAEKAFLHIPATQFLCKLQDLPISTELGKFALSERDWLVFRKVASSSTLRDSLAEAIKELNAATRGKKLTKE